LVIGELSRGDPEIRLGVIGPSLLVFLIWELSYPAFSFGFMLVFLVLSHMVISSSVEIPLFS
jgi:hypothetical protein